MRHSGGRRTDAGLRSPRQGRTARCDAFRELPRACSRIALYGYGPEVCHRREPVGVRILLAAVAVIGQIGRPAALEALSGAHRGNGGVALVLVAPARLDAEAGNESRFVEIQGQHHRLGVGFRDAKPRERLPEPGGQQRAADERGTLQGVSRLDDSAWDAIALSQPRVRPAALPPRAGAVRHRPGPTP